MVVDLFRSRAALEAEIWTLRQQINVLRRTAPKRVSFRVFDRLVFVGLYRLFPNICDALAIVKPDTIVRWHRAGFRSSWRWKSRPLREFMSIVSSNLYTAACLAFSRIADFSASDLSSTIAATELEFLAA